MDGRKYQTAGGVLSFGYDRTAEDVARSVSYEPNISDRDRRRFEEWLDMPTGVRARVWQSGCTYDIGTAAGCAVIRVREAPYSTSS